MSDVGPGIAPGTLPHIFDPYFTTKEVGKGSGMGLAVVIGIVKSHGGAISVDSSPGSGTTFNLMFPLVDDSPAPPAESNAEIPRGKAKILLVDDEAPLLSMAQKMLNRLGYRVECFQYPIEALVAIEADPNGFDLVITDMSMPQMDGIALSKRIKALRADIPVIISSGYSSKVNPGNAGDLGFAAFINKPTPMIDLARTIRSVLDRG